MLQEPIANGPKQMRIWQQNLNKSLVAQQDLLNTISPDEYDLILLQEPYIDHNGKTRANHRWRVVYPSSFYTDQSTTRSVLLVNTSLDTNFWKQLDIQTNDITAIQMTGDFGSIAIFNIYNDCRHSRMLRMLEQYLAVNL